MMKWRNVRDLHKGEYSRDFHSDPECCATYHKQYIKDPTNNWGWMKFQGQYGEWLASPSSERNERGFSRETAKLSRRCHMPVVPPNGPSAASDGGARSHRFTAANSALPWLDGDRERHELTRDTLKARNAPVDQLVVTTAADESVEEGQPQEEPGEIKHRSRFPENPEAYDASPMPAPENEPRGPATVNPEEPVATESQ
jgi:hypothetical protein